MLFGGHRSGGIKAGVDWSRNHTVSHAQCAVMFQKVSPTFTRATFVHMLLLLLV